MAKGASAASVAGAGLFVTVIVLVVAVYSALEMHKLRSDVDELSQEIAAFSTTETMVAASAEAAESSPDATPADEIDASLGALEAAVDALKANVTSLSDSQPGQAEFRAYLAGQVELAGVATEENATESRLLHLLLAARSAQAAAVTAKNVTDGLEGVVVGGGVDQAIADAIANASSRSPLVSGAYLPTFFVLTPGVSAQQASDLFLFSFREPQLLVSGRVQVTPAGPNSTFSVAVGLPAEAEAYFATLLAGSTADDRTCQGNGFVSIHSQGASDFYNRLTVGAFLNDLNEPRMSLNGRSRDAQTKTYVFTAMCDMSAGEATPAPPSSA